MECPSCKSEIPETSKFCLNCGEKVIQPTQKVTDYDFEYESYVYEIGRKYSSVGKAHSVVKLAQEEWQDYQANILPDLRKWIDKGWEPISEVGPAGFRIREEPLGCWTLIFDSSAYNAQRNVYIENFVVKMRRKKSQ